MNQQRKHLVRTTIGTLVGVVVGAIVAVNIVIFAGVDDGYEATPVEVFEQKPIVGVVAVVAFSACTIGGAIVANRRHDGHHS